MADSTSTTTIAITLAGEPGPTIRVVRTLLKTLLRRCGVRCLEVRPLAAEVASVPVAVGHDRQPTVTAYKSDTTPAQTGKRRRRTTTANGERTP